MTEIEHRIVDLINFSSSQKPLEFGDAFKTIMQDRVAAAIEAKKQEVAATMFNQVNDDEYEDSTESDETDAPEEIEDEVDAEVA